MYVGAPNQWVRQTLAPGTQKGTVGHMDNKLVEVTIKHVMPTANGCAVFLGNDTKNFVVYVDHFVGGVIQMTLDGVKKDRPLTHDLIGHILLGFGATVEHVVINGAKEGTFFARLHMRMENELGKKILELDARPSDSIVLALQHKRPICVTRPVFEELEDATDLLERVINQQQQDEAGADNPAASLFPGFGDFDDDDDEDDEDEDDAEDDDDEDDVI